MAVLRAGSKYSHIPCMLRFFATLRLALRTDPYFEIASSVHERIPCPARPGVSIGHNAVPLWFCA
jgi:hypothetical protein